jgi:hypothetical protein
MTIRKLKLTKKFTTAQFLQYHYTNSQLLWHTATRQTIIQLCHTPTLADPTLLTTSYYNLNTANWTTSSQGFITFASTCTYFNGGNQQQHILCHHTAEGEYLYQHLQQPTLSFTGIGVQGPLPTAGPCSIGVYTFSSPIYTSDFAADNPVNKDL